MVRFSRLGRGGGLLAAVALACVIALPAAADDAAHRDLTAQEAMSALRGLCLAPDSSPAAVLARADSAGWTSARPPNVESWNISRNRAKQAGSTTLLLDAVNVRTDEVDEDSCSISARAQTTGWSKAMREWLGISPSLTLGPTLVFYAVRTPTGWRSATPSDRTTAQDLHYNFVATDGAWGGRGRAAAVMVVDHFHGPHG